MLLHDNYILFFVNLKAVVEFRYKVKCTNCILYVKCISAMAESDKTLMEDGNLSNNNRKNSAPNIVPISSGNVLSDTHPTHHAVVSEPSTLKRKQTSFQITSVTVKGSRLSTDGGEDSADDLDESHTEDASSDILDCSRNTDVDNEQLSEDNSNTTNNDDASIPAPSIPVKCKIEMPVKQKTQTDALKFPSEASKIDQPSMLSENTQSDYVKPPTLPDQWQHRFRVVKIVSSEPFKRGRWLCMDFMDPPAPVMEAKAEIVESSISSNIQLISSSLSDSIPADKIAHIYEISPSDAYPGSISVAVGSDQIQQPMYGIFLPINNGQYPLITGMHSKAVPRPIEKEIKVCETTKSNASTDQGIQPQSIALSAQQPQSSTNLQQSQNVSSNLQKQQSVTSSSQHTSTVASSSQQLLNTTPSLQQPLNASSNIQQQNVPSNIQQQNVPSNIQQQNVPSNIQQQNVPSNVQQQNVSSTIQQQNVSSSIQQQNISSSIPQHQTLSSGIQQQNVSSSIQQQQKSSIQQQTVVTSLHQPHNVSSVIPQQQNVINMQQQDAQTTIQASNVNTNIQQSQPDINTTLQQSQPNVGTSLQQSQHNINPSVQQSHQNISTIMHQAQNISSQQQINVCSNIHPQQIASSGMPPQQNASTNIHQQDISTIPQQNVSANLQQSQNTSNLSQLQNIPETFQQVSCSTPPNLQEIQNAPSNQSIVENQQSFTGQPVQGVPTLTSQQQQNSIQSSTSVQNSSHSQNIAKDLSMQQVASGEPAASLSSSLSTAIPQSQLTRESQLTVQQGIPASTPLQNQAVTIASTQNLSTTISKPIPEISSTPQMTEVPQTSVNQAAPMQTLTQHVTIAQTSTVGTQASSVHIPEVSSTTSTLKQETAVPSQIIQNHVETKELGTPPSSNLQVSQEVGLEVTSSKSDINGEEAESVPSGTSTVAIDNKIEQAMDLVKSHLMFAVREEVDVLKEKITELMDRISQLEYENGFLRANASQQTLEQLNQTQLLQQQQQNQPSTVSMNSVPPVSQQQQQLNIQNQQPTS